MTPEETGAVSQDSGQAASAIVAQGLHSAASVMETNRKSPRSAKAILGRLARSDILGTVSYRPLSVNKYRLFYGVGSATPTVCCASQS